MKPWLIIIILGFALAGCATLPAALRAPNVTSFTVSEAQQGQAPAGVRVRWGGTIAQVRNGQAHTWMEIVEQPLARNGRPHRTDQSDGRFLARFTGFLDPAIYATGRKLTVVGELEHTQVRTIGQFSYTFPVVKVTSFHLWRPLPKRRYWPTPNPFWYNPWYPWGYPFY